MFIPLGVKDKERCMVKADKGSWKKKNKHRYGWKKEKILKKYYAEL